MHRLWHQSLPDLKGKGHEREAIVLIHAERDSSGLSAAFALLRRLFLLSHLSFRSRTLDQPARLEPAQGRLQPFSQRICWLGKLSTAVLGPRRRMAPAPQAGSTRARLPHARLGGMGVAAVAKRSPVCCHCDGRHSDRRLGLSPWRGRPLV